ncbi:MAG: lamin tail domain-containing protein, partial [bacterium]
GDNLIIIDASGIRMDSVSYITSWGGNSGGYSLEKIDPSINSNNGFNWGTSINPLQATPNKQNSITPKPFDLIIKSFMILPLFPSEGETLEFNIVLKNSGLNSAENYSLNIYRDLNLDSITQNNELINSHSGQILNRNDSLIYNYSIQNIDTGLKQYIVKIIYAEDDDTLNNTSVRRIYVSGLSGNGGLVINEIMYDPLPNQSEWIEFYNASGQQVNLKKWKYKESSTTISLSAQDLFLNPGDYFILAHDSTILNSFNFLKNLSSNQIIKFSNSISLSNSGENISLTDSLNNVIDGVSYNPNWNNPELADTKGISLERINPSFSSNDKNNWNSCASLTGGTPGLQNSIFLKNLSANSAVTISPNPFSPDGDGFEDFALIKYKLNVSFAQIRITVFDIKGRIVRTLANNQFTGNEGSIIFNGFGEDNQRLRIGIYILIIEAVDDRGGTVNEVKAPIVVAARL